MRIRTLPRNDPHCGWYLSLPPPPQARVLAGGQRAHYVVIGGGFTGVAAARRLAELQPDAHIALVEAGRIGDGAAGRSSGFIIDQAHNIRASSFADGLENEKRQLRINREGIAYLRSTVHERGIACGWREDGKVHAAATARGVSRLEDFARTLDALGQPYSRLDATQLKQIVGTGYYRAGLHTPGTVLAQPAALVRGLGETLPANVAVYEESAVVEIAYGPPHRLRTSGGLISADSVLLANNGFGAFFGFYRHHLLPVVTFGSLTRRLTADERARLGGHESWGVIPADPFGTSVRRTPDHRILIRNIYAYASGFHPTEPQRRRARARHEHCFRARFPMLQGVGFEYSWGGALCLSRNGEPVFGELAPGVFASICHNGVGIARGTICGKLLAELAVGHPSESLDIMLAYGRPSRKFPEPITALGARLTLAYRRMRAAREL